MRIIRFNLPANREGFLNKKKTTIRRDDMEKGEKLVIVGCSGAGGPAAMMSKKLMPEVDVTVIRKERFFIVR